MVHIAARWVVAGWLLIAAVIGAEQVRAQTITERREAAVLQARAGHLEAAIRTSRSMLAAGEEQSSKEVREGLTAEVTPRKIALNRCADV
jgi:hypothetical protein